jgi:hypothetical protein
MSTQYRLVQSGKTASGGWSAGPRFVRAVAPRIIIIIVIIISVCGSSKVNLVTLGGLVVIVLAIRPKIRGSKPCWERWIFKGDKICYTTFSEGK